MQRPSHAALNLFEPGLCAQLLGRDVRPRHVSRVAARLAVVAVAWLPIVLLSSIERRAVAIPLVRDVALHVRLLIELPCLLLFPFVATSLVGRALDYARAELVPAKSRAELDAVIASTRRAKDSPVVAIAVFAFAVTVSWVELGSWLEVRSGIAASSWRFHDGAPSPAGLWFALVARPIFYAQLFMWIYRFALWTRVLWTIRRLATPVPAHPDGVGGLSPLAIGHEAFAVIAFVIGADLAAGVAMRLLHLHDSILSYRSHVLLVIVGLTTLLLAPLSIFAPALYSARVRATFVFGAAASDEARYVETSLREGKDPSRDKELFEAHIHTAESLKRVRHLGLVPIHRRTLIIFLAAVAAPFVASTLAQIPLRQLLVDLHRLSAFESLR